MKNLEPLAIFARVAELKSFTQAAESLGIQKGRASMVVRELEQELGATLLHRTTRSVQLTEDGRAFMPARGIFSLKPTICAPCSLHPACR